jgi:integrase
LQDSTDEDVLNQVSKWCENFSHAEDPKKKPIFMKPKVFNKFLESGKEDVVFTAMILTAINCGMTQTELAAIRLEDIDFDESALQIKRAKNNIIRAAVLWDRTLYAIKQMLKERSIETDYLFIREDGLLHNKKSITDMWDKYKNIVGANNYTFKSLRKATQNLVKQADPSLYNETEIMLGHALSHLENNYSDRTPTMTKRACKVLEDILFQQN